MKEADSMQSKRTWKPTKFVRVDHRWRASRDPKEVAIASRLIGDLMASFYQEAIEQYAVGRLVDLGCGKAPLYGMYQNKTDSVVRVDWEQSLHGSEFVDHKMDLNGALEFSDESFDTVLSTDVLEHIREPMRFWSEMARICKVGGHVILGTPFLYWIHEHPYDYARYTKYNLIYECERHGLKVISIKEYGGAPEVIFDLLIKTMRNHARICSVMDTMAHCLLGLPSIKRCSKKSRQLFPLGYCMVAVKL
jgi:SAM-dependent methyltransferase